MKKHTLLYCAFAMLLLAGCEDFNDKLDGYTGDYAPEDVKTLSYTLTDADYKTIANNTTNKSIALAESPEDSVYYKLLSKVGSNKYLTDDIKGQTYIPAFLAATYTTASDGSAIKVSYNYLVGEPEYLSELSDATTYRMSDTDYETVWKDKGINASFLTPKTVSKIPSLLKTGLADAKAGDVVMVNYDYSATEPGYGSTGTDKEIAGPWQPLVINSYSDGSNWNFISNTTDLSAYAGKKVQIAFRYASDGTNSNTSTWEVKNVEVTAGGSSILSESFAASLGDFEIEGDLPDGLSYVWSYNASGYAKASAYSSGTRYQTESYLVSPVISLTAGAQISFDHAYRYCADAADYLKLYIREIATVSGDATDGYYHVTNFAGEGSYLIVASVDGALQAATPLSAKNYGYLTPTTLSATDGFIAQSEDADNCAYTFAATEAGYTLFGSDSRYVYMSGTYNSFNFASTYGELGYDWAVTTNGDGTFRITNVEKDKYIQFDASYSSYGAYADAKGVLPSLYKYKSSTATKKGLMTRASTPVVSYNASAIYTFDGSSWKEYSEDDVDVSVINPAVYNSLGVEYVSDPASVLPAYLKNYYPFASEGDKKAIVYYSSSAKAISAKELVLTGGEWIMTTSTEVVTDQFVRSNGVWVYDPSVVITLPAGKGIEISTLYYQAAVDWVWENIDVAKLGCTNKGDGYVTSYANNEYYTGCSAYQGNVDWRISAAKAQYPTEYNSMSDADILASMQERFTEVMGYVLEGLYPDVTTIDGVDITYTINFAVYDGSTTSWTVQYLVTGTGKFEYVDNSLKKVE